MIDAVGATLLAYEHEGEPHHARRRCIGAKVWDKATRASRDHKGYGSHAAFERVMDEAGYSPLIRYALQSWEVEIVEDMAESPDAFGLTGNETNDELFAEAELRCVECEEPFATWPSSEAV